MIAFYAYYHLVRVAIIYKFVTKYSVYIQKCLLAGDCRPVKAYGAGSSLPLALFHWKRVAV